MTFLKILSIPSEAPSNEKELLDRANMLAGLNLGELAKHAGLVIPANLKQDKGWIGILLERYLGANAGNKSEQDFPTIGVELKTIPVNSCNGQPVETTCVCVARLTNNIGITWETSYIRYKLARVLWIPIEGQQKVPLAQRRIGTPLLWSPNAEEEMQLRRDWEELMDLIVLGKIEYVHARHGEVLQLRPKAATGQMLTTAIGELGQPILIKPRGFYLKRSFTRRLLARHFLI